MDDVDPSHAGNTRKSIQKLLSSIRAEEIMRPRSQVTMINADSPFSEIMQTLIRDGHSRFPVFQERIDNIIGILYVKDLLRLYPEKLVNTNLIASSFLRKPLFVSENKKASKLLVEFKESHIHMAIVVDEYGTMLGIITLEDILEEIVGEIHDEFDKIEDRNYSPTGTGNHVVYPRMPIEEFNKVFKTRIQSEDFETIGGFILDQFGHVPKQEEAIDYGNYKLTIGKVEGSRIQEILVERK